MSDKDVAMKPPRNAKASHLDRWLAAKLANPEKWQREWDEAKKESLK